MSVVVSMLYKGDMANNHVVVHKHTRNIHIDVVRLAKK